jgi:phage tail sheath protein FI
MAYKAPGVFVEEIAKLPPSIAEVETAIPAFIGYTQNHGQDQSLVRTYVDDLGASHDISVARISSLLEYETIFGKTPMPFTVTVQDTVTDGVITAISASAATNSTALEKNTLYYHLQLYFANGGGPCYIFSVGTVGSVDYASLNAGLGFVQKYDEPTLLVIPEAVKLPSADIANLYNKALAQAGLLKDRFVIMDSHYTPSGSVLSDADTFRNTEVGTSDLKYGAAYYPSLKTTLGYVYSETQVTISHQRVIVTNGTAAAPVAVTYGAGNFLSQVRPSAVPGRDTIYNAVKQAVESITLTLNPSATIAGVYAAVDSTRGVWKAPANISLNYVTGPAKPISDSLQESLNVHADAGKSINAIRSFTGKGTLVWGARTLAGNDNEWRYISVRRFFNMVEESTKKATAAFVFEPNDANTWTKVQGMIENYLLTLWRAGALQGAKPEQAFYVAVGLGKTMTAQDILEGRMYVEIGLAAVRPAEFIVLRFSHMMAQS